VPSIRIYQKKQIRLDRLSFRQTGMFKIANVGVAAVKNRLAAAQGPGDGAAKPLTKRYAIWKTKHGRGNRRNLMLTGDMLRNFLVRTVSENKARAANSTRKDRRQSLDHEQDRTVGRVLSQEPRDGSGGGAENHRGDGAAPRGGARPGRQTAMIDTSVLVDNLVAVLRDIPELVEEMGGDPERIFAYHDQYPKNISLAHAIHQMRAPSIMAVWQGTGLAPSARRTCGSITSHCSCAHERRLTASRRRRINGCSGSSPRAFRPRAVWR
jgi:hypothetical protein